VGREDGFATREDLGTHIGTDRFGEHLASVPLSILSHVPPALGPTTAPDGTMCPFSVKTERAAVRIQAVWRDAVDNPGRAVCRQRLLREFEEMVEGSSSSPMCSCKRRAPSTRPGGCCKL
jgi:hypothetical protein